MLLIACKNSKLKINSFFYVAPEGALLGIGLCGNNFIQQKN